MSATITIDYKSLGTELLTLLGHFATVALARKEAADEFRQGDRLRHCHRPQPLAAHREVRGGVSPNRASSSGSFTGRVTRLHARLARFTFGNNPVGGKER